MKATISLKKLRTDPREYIRLLNSGFEVTVTDHRRVLTRSKKYTTFDAMKRGDGTALLELISTIPKINAIFPKEDTTDLFKRIKLEYLENKVGKV